MGRRCTRVSVLAVLLATGCAGPRGIGLGPQARGGGAAGPATSFPGDPWAPRGGSVGAVGPAAWRNGPPDEFSRGVGYTRPGREATPSERYSDEGTITLASAERVELGERPEREEEVSTLPVALHIQLPPDDSPNAQPSAPATRLAADSPATSERRATQARPAKSGRQTAAASSRELPMAPSATRWGRLSDPETQQAQAVVADSRPEPVGSARRATLPPPSIDDAEPSPRVQFREERTPRDVDDPAEALPSASEPPPDAPAPAAARSATAERDSAPATRAPVQAPSLFSAPPELPAPVLAATEANARQIAEAPRIASVAPRPVTRARRSAPAGSRSTSPAPRYQPPAPREATSTPPSVSLAPPTIPPAPPAMQPVPPAIPSTLPDVLPEPGVARALSASRTSSRDSNTAEPAPGSTPPALTDQPASITEEFARVASSSSADTNAAPVGSRLASILGTPATDELARPAPEAPSSPAPAPAPAPVPSTPELAYAVAAPEETSTSTPSVPPIAPAPPPPFAPPEDSSGAPMGRPRLGWTAESAGPTILPPSSATFLFPPTYGPPMPSPTLPQASPSPNSAQPTGRTIKLELGSPPAPLAQPAPPPRRSWRPRLLSRLFTAAAAPAGSR